MRGNVLSTAELKRLAEHKYSAQGTSFLEPLMQPFWRWVVELLPLWFAPNAITLAGLIINAVTAFVLMLFSPDAKGEVNRFLTTFFTSGCRETRDTRVGLGI